MSDSNRIVVAALVMVALVCAFWLALLAPKREQASKLGTEVQKLRSEVAAAEEAAAAAEEAKQGFGADYEQLVLLGKAVPADSDTASLLVQIEEISQKAGVEFRTLALEESGETASAPVPAATPIAPVTPPPDGATTEAAPVSAPVPAAEASAALLPIGATIGSAGLGVMPYKLTFTGEFFEVADFIKGLDSLVKTNTAEVAADGRLITVDGFSLVAEESSGFPQLEATFVVTTYLTPPGQGLTAGATPAAPVAPPAIETSTTPTTP